MKNLFSSFFGRDSKSKDSGGSVRPTKPAEGARSRDARSIGEPYKKGDVIGHKYEFYSTLGKGGCGVVYLVYSHGTKSVYALKTFRDEYLQDEEIREQFRKEAQVWVNLGHHPYLVRASFVENLAGRLYIAMEHIAPDADGVNSLEGYLLHNPPDLEQSLRWAIQFCHGMEYAYTRGIRCHRDIKPANILIGQDKLVKISDFGLAGVLGTSKVRPEITLNIHDGIIGMSRQTLDGGGFGTLTHMSPEQFANAASCDERSDIYSFGVVLYQMASSGRLPFLAARLRDNSREELLRFEREMRRLHCEAIVVRLSSPLFPMIEQCLAKDPDRRHQTFQKLRGELETLLYREKGEVIRSPAPKALQAWDWSNKGISLAALERYQDALVCFDQAQGIVALQIDPQDAIGRTAAILWCNKGNCLELLGHHQEALDCCDRALAINPQHANAWKGKAISLYSLGRHKEALECADRVLAINPRDITVLYNKGNTLTRLGRYQEALKHYGEALEINPRYDAAWNNEGFIFAALEQHQTAINRYDRALAINPQNADAWNNKANSLYCLKQYKDALDCCDCALAVDSQSENAWINKAFNLMVLKRDQDAVGCFDRALAMNPQNAVAWKNKGKSLYLLGHCQEACQCYAQALAINPQDGITWRTRGLALSELGRDREALECYERALEINSRDASAWFGKALSEEGINRRMDAAAAYQKFIELGDPSDVETFTFARERLRHLGS